MSNWWCIFLLEKKTFKKHALFNEKCNQSSFKKRSHLEVINNPEECNCHVYTATGLNNPIPVFYLKDGVGRSENS